MTVNVNDRLKGKSVNETQTQTPTPPPPQKKSEREGQTGRKWTNAAHPTAVSEDSSHAGTTSAPSSCGRSSCHSNRGLFLPSKFQSYLADLSSPFIPKDLSFF